MVQKRSLISNFNHFHCLKDIEIKFGLQYLKKKMYLVCVENIIPITSIVLTQQRNIYKFKTIKT